jgi:cysteine desulfurase
LPFGENSMRYLDHNATTPLLEAVIDAMQPYWHLTGNAASTHQLGRFMRTSIDEARHHIAALIDVHPSDIIFTSGGTEANNFALKGWIAAHPDASLYISTTEHDSIFKTAQQLAAQGVPLTWLPVDTNGILCPLPEVTTPQPALCSVMLANNESGIIQPIKQVSDWAHVRNMTFHTDASQAIGKMPVNFKTLGVDMMTLSAHKMGGPLGIGALVRKSSVPLSPLLMGGGHQQGLRSGTENVAAMVGFGKAAEIIQATLAQRITHCRVLQQQLEAGLSALPGVKILGEHANRLSNTTLLAVPGLDAEMLVIYLDKQDCAISSGSACHGQTETASQVIEAMQVPHALAGGVIRVSVGIQNTSDDIHHFLQSLRSIMASCQTLLSI